MNQNLKKIIFGSDKLKPLFSGILVCIIIAAVAVCGRKLFYVFAPNFGKTLSPVLLAILLGLIIGNFLKIPQALSPGIKFCVAKCLRLGIILMGIRLSLMEVNKIGMLSIVLVIACISAGLLVTAYAARFMGISRKLGTLIAAGTGICGISAIVATSPSIDAKEEETAYAAATVALFGIIVTFVYPYITHTFLNMDTIQAGLFMGTAVHDTSQVTGAGLIYDQLWLGENYVGPTAADVAITTKMVRNIFLVVVVPLLTLMYAKGKDKTHSLSSTEILKLFPLFVIGFVAFALIRTIGDYAVTSGLLGQTFWDKYCSWQTTAGESVLAVSLAGVGLSTRFDKLKLLGIKPIIVGFTAAASVGAVSLILVKILAPHIKI